MADRSITGGTAEERRMAPAAQGLLRIVAGFLFFQHGFPKIIASLPGSGQPFEPVPLASWLGLSGILEVCGGLLLMLGLFTRPVAFVVAGEMAVAYFWKHAPNGFWPGVNRGELAALYCFVWLFFAAAGAGRWSLDERMRARRTGSPPV